MATEKRLIIPSELIAEIDILYQKHYVHSCDKTVHDIFNAIRRRIWKCATVDAVEVKHGRWVDAYGIRKSKCTRCGVAFGRVMDADCHYCPNCGAKMDGDGNEV